MRLTSFDSVNFLLIHRIGMRTHQKGKPCTLSALETEVNQLIFAE